MFPILMNQKEREELKKLRIDVPAAVPIGFVKQYEEQILMNHQQTVDGLKGRGGLHPTELCAAMYGLPLHIYFGNHQLTNEQTIFALNMIALRLKQFNTPRGG